METVDVAAIVTFTSGGGFGAGGELPTKPDSQEGFGWEVSGAFSLLRSQSEVELSKVK